MATQIFDDGSTLTETTTTEASIGGGFTSTNATDTGSMADSNAVNNSSPTGKSNLGSIFGGVYASATAAINMAATSASTVAAAAEAAPTASSAAATTGGAGPAPRRSRAVPKTLLPPPPPPTERAGWPWFNRASRGGRGLGWERTRTGED